MPKKHLKKLDEKVKKVLQSTQKYTKLDNIYFFKNSVFVLFGHFFSALMSLAIVFFMVRIFNERTYGEYTLIFTLVEILGIFGLSGMGTALIETVGKRYEGFYKFAVKKVFKWSVLSSLLFIIAAAIYFFNGNQVVAFSMIFLALIFPFDRSYGLYDFFLRGKKRFDKALLYNLIISTNRAFFSLLVLFLFPSVFWIIVLTGVSYILIISQFSRKTLKKVSNDKIDKKSYSYGKKLTWISFINVLQIYFDKLIISIFFGLEQLAIFQVSLIIPDQVKTITNKLNMLLLPKLTTFKNTLKLKYTLRKKYILGLIISSLVVVAYISVAPLIFKYVFPKYLETSLLYSQIAAFSLLAIPMALYSSYFHANKKVKAILTNTTLASIFRLVAMIVLIYFFGVLGAIYARVISKLFSAAVNLVLFEKSSTS